MVSSPRFKIFFLSQKKNFLVKIQAPKSKTITPLGEQVSLPIIETWESFHCRENMAIYK